MAAATVSPQNPVSALVAGDWCTMTGLLGARVHRSPQSTFLSCDGRAWTYAEAWEESRRFAGWLLANAGVQPGERVAAFMQNRPEMLWAWFGALASGATFVPLNRSHRGDILLDMLSRSGARVLVTDVAGAADLPPIAASLVETILVVDAGGWDEVLAVDAVEARLGHSASVAEVLYTSGTTGRSKAVPLTHEHLCRGAGWVAWSLELGQHDIYHVWLPLFHVAAQIDCILSTVVGGGSVALYPTFSLSRFWQQVGESGATVFAGFANIGHLLLTLPPSTDDRGSTLRIGILGGMSAELRARFEERFAVALVDIFGMTEAEPITLPWPGRPCPSGSCGQAAPDFELAALDDNGARVEAGAIGELACRPLRPNVLTQGYEDDAEAMVAATRGLWFRTGDLVRIDAEGFVHWVDRKKHAIRRGGENISSWELEGVVARHPDVRECCAVGVPAPLGDDDVKIVVAAAAGSSIDPSELREWCSERLASFTVPRYIEVVDELPRTAAGKVVKAELSTVTASTWDADLALGARR